MNGFTALGLKVMVVYIELPPFSCSRDLRCGRVIIAPGMSRVGMAVQQRVSAAGTCPGQRGQYMTPLPHFQGPAHVLSSIMYAGCRHESHVRSESQSVQYVPLDIWTSCTGYKQYNIKVHSLKYGTSVRGKFKLLLSISIYDSAYTVIIDL